MAKKNGKGKILLEVCMMVLILTSLVSASLNVQLSDQGTGVSNSNGDAISGDLAVLIYDNETNGNLIYNETFSGAIRNGSWNVMLGASSVDLPLEFGKVYYKDYLIAGEDASFDSLDRQAFYSSLGDISDEDISSTTNITTTGYGFFSWLGNLLNRITGLFVQDINFNGTISSNNGKINISSETGNIVTSGNITANSAFFSNSSIYIGGLEISNVNGSFAFDGAPVIIENGSIIGDSLQANATLQGDVVVEESLDVSKNLNLGANLTFSDNQTQIYLKGGELIIEY